MVLIHTYIYMCVCVLVCVYSQILYLCTYKKIINTYIIINDKNNNYNNNNNNKHNSSNNNNNNNDKNVCSPLLVVGTDVPLLYQY